MDKKPYQINMFNNPYRNCEHCFEKENCKASVLSRDVVVCLGPYKNIKHKKNKIKRIFLKL